MLALAGSMSVYAAPPKSDVAAPPKSDVAAPPKSDVAAPPKSDVDVTITVIDDPAQLNERVNTIHLPGFDGDDAKAEKHHNKNDAAPADDKANEARESARQDAANARAAHDAANDSAHDAANDSAASNDSNQ
jgi:hypothetical protein